MDDERSQHAPDTMRELPPHVRKFLNGLEPEDIELIGSGMEFARWFQTTRRFTKAVIVFGFTVFGAAVAIGQGWEWIVSKWTTK